MVRGGGWGDYNKEQMIMLLFKSSAGHFACGQWSSSNTAVCKYRDGGTLDNHGGGGAKYNRKTRFYT